jgi:putative tricarboxylic transport membrane protein
VTATRDRHQVAAAVALFAFGLVYFLSALPLSMGTPGRPGPGLVPAVIGGLLVLCTSAHLVRTLRRSGTGHAVPTAVPARRNRLAIAGILASTIVYPLILEPLKFLLATAAVAFVMLVLLSPGRPVFSLFLALGMAVVFFVVFSRLLGVALPSGALEHLVFQIGR